MNMKQLDEQVWVAPQISIEDVAALAEQGFKCVMCNRPDGEDAGQPDWDDIAEACAAHGMEARYVPLAGRDLTDYAVHGFAAAMSETEGKLFAYCRSGTRCEILWNAAKTRLTQPAV